MGVIFFGVGVHFSLFWVGLEVRFGGILLFRVLWQGVPLEFLSLVVGAVEEGGGEEGMFAFVVFFGAGFDASDIFAESDEDREGEFVGGLGVWGEV